MPVVIVSGELELPPPPDPPEPPGGFTAPPDEPLPPSVPRGAMAPPPPHAAINKESAQISESASRREDTNVCMSTGKYRRMSGETAHYRPKGLSF